MVNIGLAVILAALIGAVGGGAAAIWFNNRNWRKRLVEFEECQTFLNDGRAYTLYRMPTGKAAGLSRNRRLCYCTCLRSESD